MKRIIQLACMAVMIYTGVQIVQYIYAYVKIDDELEEVQALVSNEKLDGLREVNPRIIGWLSLEGTRLDNPVLQAEDNDFYLRHNHLDE